MVYVDTMTSFTKWIIVTVETKLSTVILKVAKKSLIATMSELYAMTLIVICLAFTSTEIITDKVPLDYFESWGFYTYLYRYVLT